MTRTKEEVYNAQDTITSIQIQPTQQLQVTNMKKEIDQGERQLKMMLSTIQILEDGLENNPNRKKQQTLEDMQSEALKQTRYVEELKAQLSKTKDTAEKFKSYMQMPMYEQKPRWYREDRSVMDPRNITKVINLTFNPAQHPALEFKHIWTKVLRYGREHYLDERDHLRVLGYVLAGEPLETYESCMRGKKDLRETLNQLTILYGTTVTINDYKNQLNSFTRQPNESIRKTMARYHAILEKTQHGIPDHMWPMTVLIKEMTALKMFIHSKTRANIEVEEARNNNEGSALLPVEHWINRVEEFENAHNLVPTKEIKSAILTATMAPAASLDEFQHTEKQLHHYKVNHFAQKEVVDMVQQLNQKMDEILVASTAPAKPNPRYNQDNLKKLSHYSQKIGVKGNPVRVDYSGKKPALEAHANVSMDTSSTIPNPGSQAPTTNPPNPPNDQPQQAQEAQQGQQGQQGQAQRGQYRNYRGRGNRGRPQMYRIDGQIYGPVSGRPNYRRNNNYQRQNPQNTTQTTTTSPQYPTNAAQYEDDPQDEYEGDGYDYEGYDNADPDDDESEIVEITLSEN